MSKSHIKSAGNPKERHFKGVRQRKWGKWVSEVRIPNCKGRIWLGSYDTPKQAARAFDAAVYCLRGPHAKFNFPDSVPAINSATPLSPQQIRQAAAKYALDRTPDTENATTLTENAVSPSRSSMFAETTENSTDAIEVHAEHFNPAIWDSLLADSDFNQLFNAINFPLTDAVISPSEEQGSDFMWDV